MQDLNKTESEIENSITIHAKFFNVTEIKRNFCRPPVIEYTPKNNAINFST